MPQDDVSRLKEVFPEIERKVLVTALKTCRGNFNEAASILLERRENTGPNAKGKASRKPATVPKSYLQYLQQGAAAPEDVPEPQQPAKKAGAKRAAADDDFPSLLQACRPSAKERAEAKGKQLDLGAAQGTTGGEAAPSKPSSWGGGNQDGRSDAPAEQRQPEPAAQRSAAAKPEAAKPPKPRRPYAVLALLGGVSVWLAAAPGKVWREYTRAERFALHLLRPCMEMRAKSAPHLAARLALFDWSDGGIRTAAIECLLQPHELTVAGRRKCAETLRLLSEQASTNGLDIVVVDLLLERLRLAIDSGAARTAPAPADAGRAKPRELTWGAPTIDGSPEGPAALSKGQIADILRRTSSQQAVALGEFLGDLVVVGVVGVDVACEFVLTLAHYLLRLDAGSALRISVMSAVLTACAEYSGTARCTPRDRSLIAAVVPYYAQYCFSRSPLSPDVMGAVLQTVSRCTPASAATGTPVASSLQALSDSAIFCLSSLPFSRCSVWLSLISHLRGLPAAADAAAGDADGSLPLSLVSRAKVWPVNCGWASGVPSDGDGEAPVGGAAAGAQGVAGGIDAQQRVVVGRGRGMVQSDDVFISSLIQATIQADAAAASLGAGRGRGVKTAEGSGVLWLPKR
ncbi:hypothetical protein DIPPA_17929 [Diplonema papillatum]|nr:hypothetical protein DIPPA_17929 [Diplonema papillatum]